MTRRSTAHRGRRCRPRSPFMGPRDRLRSQRCHCPGNCRCPRRTAGSLRRRRPPRAWAAGPPACRHRWGWPPGSRTACPGPVRRPGASSRPWRADPPAPTAQCPFRPAAAPRPASSRGACSRPSRCSLHSSRHHILDARLSGNRRCRCSLCGAHQCHANHCQQGQAHALLQLRPHRARCWTTTRTTTRRSSRRSWRWRRRSSGSRTMRRF
mmetsp:Transcript_102320/g.248720  ORF Transcript_102320/g.248720 Transcript_102320/m.248720 type:complete len:210 (-) Transcript_102320:154-783(-)